MLTVMTYNVGAGLAAPLRLVEVLRQSGADIIGLQELAPEQGAAIADLLGSDYPYHVLHATGIPGKGLLSRYPVRETQLLEHALEIMALRGRSEASSMILSVPPTSRD